MAGQHLSRGRSIAVWACILLAALIGFVSALTVWVKRQALETDKWVATSSRLLEDDEIRGALSLYLVDQLYANVDVAAELQQSLPPRREAARRPRSPAVCASSRSARRTTCCRVRASRRSGRRRTAGRTRRSSTSSTATRIV